MKVGRNCVLRDGISKQQDQKSGSLHVRQHTSANSQEAGGSEASASGHPGGCSSVCIQTTFTESQRLRLWF